MTDDECKKIIIRIAKRLSVRASLITTLMLSEDDKNDMRAGELAVDSLEAHIQAWILGGIPSLIERRSLENEPKTCLKREETKIGYMKPFVGIESCFKSDV